MTDIFLSPDVRSLFENKKVVFIGDSNIRALYKDMLCLYNKSELITQKVLKNKMENSVFGDKLGFHKERTNGRDYREERLYQNKNFHFAFYFVTRVYNEYMEEILTKIMQDKEPDVIIINSCAWDLTRWGPQGVEEFKKNMVTLMKRFNQILSENCLVIWTTTSPISQEVRGGFLVIQLDFLKYCLRFHVMEANHYARKVVVNYGYDVLDLHYHLRMQIQHRANDGCHWFPPAVRYVLNLLLTHISLAWGVPLPHRNDSIITRRVLDIPKKDDDAFELEMNKDSPLPLKKTKPNPKRRNRNRNSHQAFAKRERHNQTRRNMRAWAQSSYYPSPPRRMEPWYRHNQEDGSPYQFSAVSRRVILEEPPQYVARNAAAKFSDFGGFHDLAYRF